MYMEFDDMCARTHTYIYTFIKFIHICTCRCNIVYMLCNLVLRINVIVYMYTYHTILLTDLICKNLITTRYISRNDFWKVWLIYNKSQLQQVNILISIFSRLNLRYLICFAHQQMCVPANISLNFSCWLYMYECYKKTWKFVKWYIICLFGKQQVTTTRSKFMYYYIWESSFPLSYY